MRILCLLCAVLVLGWYGAAAAVDRSQAWVELRSTLARC
jgi:hypothetical protein